MSLLAYLSYLFMFLLGCKSSPADLRPRYFVPLSPNASSSASSTTQSFDSTLVLTVSTDPDQIATFYPSRVTDTRLWDITSTTLLSQAERVYASGYEWIPSPAPSFPCPIVPSDAPWPSPGISSVSFPHISTSQTETAGTLTLTTGVETADRITSTPTEGSLSSVQTDSTSNTEQLGISTRVLTGISCLRPNSLDVG